MEVLSRTWIRALLLLIRWFGCLHMYYRHSYVCHDTFIICVTWLILLLLIRWPGCLQKSSMIYSYVCHDTFIICGHDSFCWSDDLDVFRSVPWRIHMCAMTHSSYVWYDSFSCTQMSPKEKPDAFVCVLWWIHTNDDTTNSHVWHYAFMCV